jgi:hypothetical protein
MITPKPDYPIGMAANLPSIINAGAGMIFSEQYDETVETNLTNSITNSVDRVKNNQGWNGPHKTVKQLNELFKTETEAFGFAFDREMNEASAKAVVDRHRRKAERELIWNNAGFMGKAAGVAGMLAGGLNPAEDPVATGIGIALPVTRAAAFLKPIEKLVTAAAPARFAKVGTTIEAIANPLGQRISAQATLSAIDGAFGNLLATPIIAYDHAQDYVDYGMGAALADVTMGALLGAGMGASTVGLSHFFRGGFPTKSNIAPVIVKELRDTPIFRQDSPEWQESLNKLVNVLTKQGETLEVANAKAKELERLTWGELFDEVEAKIEEKTDRVNPYFSGVAKDAVKEAMQEKYGFTNNEMIDAITDILYGIHEKKDGEVLTQILGERGQDASDVAEYATAGVPLKDQMEAFKRAVHWMELGRPIDPEPRPVEGSRPNGTETGSQPSTEKVFDPVAYNEELSRIRTEPIFKHDDATANVDTSSNPLLPEKKSPNDYKGDTLQKEVQKQIDAEEEARPRLKPAPKEEGVKAEGNSLEEMKKVWETKELPEYWDQERFETELDYLTEAVSDFEAIAEKAGFMKDLARDPEYRRIAYNFWADTVLKNVNYTETERKMMKDAYMSGIGCVQGAK